MRRFDADHLLVATHNTGKRDEIAALLAPFGISTSYNADHGLSEPAETEETFVGNARIKARTGMSATGLATLADDSGIEILALDGRPGVRTADWAETGSGRDFGIAMARAQSELDAIGAAEPRLARFVCSLVMVWPDGHEEAFEGHVDGRLIWPTRGQHGHGYDPMFQPVGHSKTFAEMSATEKNRISHRAAAFAKLIDGCFG